MKRFLSFLLLLAVLSALLTACGQNAPTPTEASQPPENIPDDNCRNWYEIFVYSFADSDGDRIGDLRGATEKLDYVRDMGFTGIWLMPIMPSPSYHKYDVTDYYAIDPAYGSLEDFQAFLDKAHTLGIKVILDLVLNHTSNQHPWFQDAKTGKDAAYRDYYNFQSEAASGYQQLGDSYYECRFVSTMPDLNLDAPAVRDEIVHIMTYWLDMGVDGFRLDAVTSYYTGNNGKNIEFLSWLKEEAKRIDPDCYMVGECWADESTIVNYYTSGIDSFFCFPLSTGSGKGALAAILDEEATARGAAYGELTMHLEERYGADTLMAPFLDNHDTDRIASVVGVYSLERLKIAYGMLSMLRGGTYVYYGGETGMIGTGADPNKRIGMLWTTLPETTACPPGTTEAKYPLESVEKQEADENSLLNYVRAAMGLRNTYPAIARGTTELLPTEDEDLCLLRRTWEDESILIVLNLSAEKKSVTVDAQALLAVLDANAAHGIGAAYENAVLTLDPWGIAILR